MRKIFSLNRSLSATAFLVLMAVSGLTQKPQLVLQTAHSDFVTSAAFSPDGRTLASGSWDHSIKLWDVSSGTELRLLKGHSDHVNSVVFSHDGKTLASGSDDHSIKLWDVSTGTELRLFKGHSGGVFSVAFSPDGKIIASGSDDHSIKLWDVSTGTELRALKGHSAIVGSVAFSPDRKILATGSGDTTVKLWDVSTGAELRTLKGHSSYVYSVAFSPDGKTLASGSDDHSIKLWDVLTGSELRTFKGHSKEVFSVAFSPDGKTLASGSMDHSIKLWDVLTGSELRTLKGHSSYVFSVTFSPNGKTLASGSEDKTVKLWDVSTGTELRTLKGHSEVVFSVTFSPDGKTLASGNDDHSIKLWDVSTGRELRTLKGHSAEVFSVTFSPDGTTLASGSMDHSIKLWDVSSGTELRTLKGHSEAIFLVAAFCPDGKILASGGDDYTVKLWDVSTGTELRTLTGHSVFVVSVAFSPDGKTLASGSYDDTVKLWDVSTGTELRTLTGHSKEVSSVAFSSDGKTLASGSWDHSIKLWDVSAGTELRTLKGHSSSVNSVAFRPDGKTLASGSDDHSIKQWDVATGTELRTLNEHSASVTSVAFSPNGKTLASSSWDNSIKVWEMGSGKEVASLIALDEQDWIVITPDGLFDGSPAAWKNIIWRFNNNTFDHAPVEAFFREYWRPGLLQDIMAGKHPEPPKIDISAIDIRQPEVRITKVDGQATIEQALGEPVKVAKAVGNRNFEITIEVVDNTNPPLRSDHSQSSGAKDLRLFRNGSLVKLWQGNIFDKQSGCGVVTTKPNEPHRTICKATVSVISGANKFTAYAFNHQDVKSQDAELVATGADSLRRAGTLYVLAVGVNEYANSQYNLKYAVADAQGFAEELKRQQSKLNNYERVGIISLNDQDATKANILKSLADLSAKIQPEDALFIFFAGHGTAQQNRFYLIPHDLGYAGSRTQLDSAGLQGILSHSISDEELERAVEGIDAGQLLLVIDACNSGQALESEEKRRGPMNSKGLAQLAYEKGMYILTAAQSYQAAQEAARLGHGYLTYALVEEGLKTNAADLAPEDGQVLLREWLDFATARVPEMQQETIKEQQKQGRQLEQVIKFAEADAGAERRVQRPRVFYRREAESQPLIVARP